MHKNTDIIKKASKKEIVFMKNAAPRGMWKMVEIRTKKTRMQVLYQITQMPPKQDKEIIQASREILFAITGLKYEQPG